MDTIRLRIMTEKSIIGFGKYTDLSVGNLLAQLKTKELRWIYYNCSMLSFMPNILDLIYITDEFKIQKPGTNKELGQQLNEICKKRMSGFTNFKIANHTRRVLKSKMTASRKVDNIRFSKGTLQRKNQGH